MARVMAEVPGQLSEEEISRALISAQGRFPLHLHQPHKGKEILGVFVPIQKLKRLKSQRQHQNWLCKALNPPAQMTCHSSRDTDVGRNATPTHTFPTTRVPQDPPLVRDHAGVWYLLGVLLSGELDGSHDQGGLGMRTGDAQPQQGMGQTAFKCRDQVGNGT